MRSSEHVQDSNDPATLAREKFGVDLTDDTAVRAKLLELQKRATRDQHYELSNLVAEFNEVKKAA